MNASASAVQARTRATGTPVAPITNSTSPPRGSAPFRSRSRASLPAISLPAYKYSGSSRKLAGSFLLEEHLAAHDRGEHLGLHERVLRRREDVLGQHDK